MLHHVRIILTAFLAFISLALPVRAERRIALVIGNDTYDKLDSRAQLRKAKSDAAAMAATFRVLGFDVIQKDDVTRFAFNEHWQDFLNKLSPGDTAAFYFAGHGIELGGRNYLLPRDIPNIRPGREELLKRESLSLQEFLADLREKKTRLNLARSKLNRNTLTAEWMHDESLPTALQRRAFDHHDAPRRGRQRERHSA